MQDVILSIIALENVNDSQKLTLIKGICEKLNDSRSIEEKIEKTEKALKLCGAFQSNLTNLQVRIDGLESDFGDLQHHVDNLEESDLRDLQHDFNGLESDLGDLQHRVDNLEIDSEDYEKLESKVNDLESLITEKFYFLTKLLIKKGVINEEEIIVKEEAEKEIPNNN